MIQAIETSYNGYRFRSRLEARWAVFYDALDIEWKYESQGFELGNDVRYLPDFWLPEQKCWIEIKGEQPNGDEENKARLLAAFSGYPVYIFFGDIPHPHPGNFDGDSAISIPSASLAIWNDLPRNDPGHRDDVLVLEKLNHASIIELLSLSDQSDRLGEEIHRSNYHPNGTYVHRVSARTRVKHLLFSASEQLREDINAHMPLLDKDDWHISLSLGGWDNQYYWCECPSCGLLGIEYNGRSDRLDCKICYYCSRIKRAGKWSLDAGQTWNCECPVHGSEIKEGCERISPNQDKGYTYDSPRLVAAYNAARSARFEHGETPKVKRGRQSK